MFDVESVFRIGVMAEECEGAETSDGALQYVRKLKQVSRPTGYRGRKGVKVHMGGVVLLRVVDLRHVELSQMTTSVTNWNHDGERKPTK